MKSVAVTGAGGFVGRHLVPRLIERGYRVVALSRRPDTLQFSDRVERRSFDPEAAPSAAAFEGVDAVVHLAGEPVSGRWTADKKRAIYDSRVRGTRTVVRSIAARPERPQVLLCASGSGYYGERGDEPLTERSQPGNDFLAKLCVDWESEARAASTLGLRVAALRTGVVLGAGGALDAMRLPFRLGAGGPFGGGKQFFPWIHIDDLVSLYIFALESVTISGPLNAVTPDYATSARFAQALGGALRRPAFIPAPAPALRLLLGEFAETLLASQLILPTAAEDAGFSWQHPLLESAIARVVSPGAQGNAHVRRFAREQIVDAPIDAVFAFFSDPRNLEEITPPSLRFQIASAPPVLQRGSEIEYRLRLRGLKIGWKTLIARWAPPHAFTDVQLHGPYALWQHTHSFVPAGSGTKIADEVLYALPYAPLSAPIASFIDREIETIFSYRRERIEQRTLRF